MYTYERQSSCQSVNVHERQSERVSMRLGERQRVRVTMCMFVCVYVCGGERERELGEVCM